MPVLYTSAYERAARLDGLGFLHPRALLGFALDADFVRRLRRLSTPVHLSNHHLARYGRFLDVPYVVTVHDLIRHRDSAGANGSPMIRRPTRRDRFLFELDDEAISSAAAVIAISEATRREVIEWLGVSAERVHVVRNGIDHARFRPKDRRLHREPYVLFVGVEHPRKNLTGLLQAFAELKRQRRFSRLRLVKVGGPGYRGGRFRRRTNRAISELGIGDAVELAGRVDDDLLPAYYSGAECLVVPSLQEGFGLPVVEAMACGCPVIVSDRASLPEIAGEAALTSAPDPGSLATALARVLDDPGLRDRLRERGLARARMFTWGEAATGTRAIYREALGAAA